MLVFFYRPGPGTTGRDRGDVRGDSRDRDMRDSRGEPRGPRGDPRADGRGDLRPDFRGDPRGDPRRKSSGHSPNGALPFIVEGPARAMIAVYDYDPQELSPNVDSEVGRSFK